MREHKYRVWDKKEKKMIYFHPLAITDSKGSLACHRKPINAVDYIDTWTTKPSEDFILMEYTGLKDSKNHEIYEGDILQRWNNVQKIWEDKIIIHSIIEDFYFNESHGFNLWGGNEEYEIRGNKCQNPELLEK